MVGRPPKKPKQDAIKDLISNKDSSLQEAPAEIMLELADRDPWTGLTERQKTIQEMKIRGISIAAMAAYFNVKPPMIMQELAAIRAVHKERGASIDKEMFAGETLSIYEELLGKAIRTFYDIKNDNPLSAQMKLQAINTISSLREKQTKLMFDLGLIDKQADKIDHSFTVKSKTFVDEWDEAARQKAATLLLESKLQKLEDPVPPEPEEGEIIEETKNE